MICVRSIQKNDWASVADIQSRCYEASMLESLEALQAKAAIEPNLCRVAVDEAGHVIAYCLAHAWCADNPPSLHSQAVASVEADNLFIHDMAIHPGAAGQGVGRHLFSSLQKDAQLAGYASISLVAVQGSATFWHKFGFAVQPKVLSPAYGEAAVYMIRGLFG